jgi:glycerate-2-kinase
MRHPYRIFGVLPTHLGVVPTARRKAEELGFTTHLLAHGLQAESAEAGRAMACVALTAAHVGEPCRPPCALFTSGELLVTVGQETGVGGRNQEYALAAALRIAGSRQVLLGAVDTDGTDGPGSQFSDHCKDIDCLAGAMVDGDTAAEAAAAGFDLHDVLKRHDTTPALWQIGSGVLATHNISIGDLGVILILEK